MDEPPAPPSADAARAAERGARRYEALLEGIAEVTAAMLERGMDEDLYARLVDLAGEHVPGVRAVSLLVPDGSGSFRIAAVRGLDADALRWVRLPTAAIEESAAAPAVRRGPPDLSRLEPRTARALRDAGAAADETRLVCTVADRGQGEGGTGGGGGEGVAALLTLHLANDPGDEALEEARQRVAILARQAAVIGQRTRLERDLRREQGRLHFMAYRDVATGLPNRNLLLERVREAIERVGGDGGGTGAAGALLLVDLFGFRLVEQAYGARLGDRLLERAGRLLEEATGGRTVARWSDTAFGVLAAPGDAPEALARRVIAAFDEPLLAEELRLRMSVAIGYRLLAAGDDPMSAARDAVAAAAAADRAGPGALRRFDEELRRGLEDRTRLMEDLRAALAGDELELHLQPRIRLADGRVAGAEALVRWTHPLLGPISPARFVPLAEETGLIVPLSDRVHELACRRAAAWARAGLRVPISVNASPAEMAGGGLPERLFAAMARHDVPPRAIEVEVTETTAMRDPEAGAAQLLRLRERGVRIALDDFGSGYASLSQLRLLPLDAIKLDRSLVAGLGPADRPSLAVPEAVAGIARALGLRSVAEGIETPAQNAVLRDMGFHEAQGFLYARPAPAAALEGLLAERGAVDADEDAEG